MSSGENAPTPYQPTGQAAADANYQSDNSQLSGAGQALYSQVAPQYQQITSNVMSNPYYAQAQAGAGQVAQAGQGVAAGQFQGASSLQGLGNLAAAYAPATMATGYDPQSALYNQQLTATQDQQNVANAQNGVAGSPFAAGVSGQATQNFNLTWEQQQQSRQAAAIAALSQLEGTAGSAYFGASTLGAQGLDTIAQTSAAPSQTYLSQQTADATALNNQVAGTNASDALTQAAVGNDASYLQIGQSATQGADNAAATNNAQSNAQSAGLGQAFGSLLSFAFI
jgi:hypothetical protein